MALPLNLTIAIPVKNEAKNLPGCLAAIGPDLAQEVVVIDSQSTDQTQEIAQLWGATVIDFVWNGRFPKKRNWYLQNYTPQTKWVLFLDADEYLTNEFKSELRNLLPQSDKTGYWLNYTVYFLGSRLKGGYPLKKLALFQVGSGEYERINENEWSHFDMEVHEHPVLEGKIGCIQAKIDHQDFQGIAHYTFKHNEYANWEAARYLTHSLSKLKSEKWTLKQRIKYNLMHSILIGPMYFCGSFILFGGFRDGARGLALAIMKMAYFTQVYCHVQEMKHLNRHSTATALK